MSQEYIRTCWIDIAIGTGGKLTVVKLESGGIEARMDWPYQRPVRGEPANLAGDAINSLNDALQEDAGDEMVNKGVV